MKGYIMKTLFVATKTGYGIEADHGKVRHSAVLLKAIPVWSVYIT